LGTGTSFANTKEAGRGMAGEGKETRWHPLAAQIPAAVSLAARKLRPSNCNKGSQGGGETERKENGAEGKNNRSATKKG